MGARARLEAGGGAWTLRLKAPHGPLVALPLLALAVGALWAVGRGLRELLAPPHLDSLPWPLALGVVAAGLLALWACAVWISYYLGAGEQLNLHQGRLRQSLGWPALGWGQSLGPAGDWRLEPNRLPWAEPVRKGGNGPVYGLVLVRQSGAGRLRRSVLGFQLSPAAAAALLQSLRGRLPGLAILSKGSWRAASS